MEIINLKVYYLKLAAIFTDFKAHDSVLITINPNYLLKNDF
jgi:hypothetical protein